MERTVTVEWRGRPVAAANPPPVAAVPIDLTVPTIRLTEKAAAAVLATGVRMSGPLEVAGRLLLKAEGLASSAIEGVRAPAVDVAMAEAGAEDPGHLASWVADNLGVVSAALVTPRPLDVTTLLDWHRRLMRHAPRIEERHVGAWRDDLGWVGGASPLTAAHVAVPHTTIPSFMDDLMAFLAREDIDPVTQAAVAHAQFETIHPLADGNGRIGRVLIGWVLTTRLDVPYPPAVSTQFARDVGGYLAGLTLFRQGLVDEWVRWFADTVRSATQRTGAVLDAVEELQREWETATAGLRADAAARRLLAIIPAHPVLSAPTVAELLAVSRPAAQAGLEALAAAGVLVESGRAALGAGRPRRWWIAEDLLALLGN